MPLRAAPLLLLLACGAGAAPPAAAPNKGSKPTEAGPIAEEPRGSNPANYPVMAAPLASPSFILLSLDTFRADRLAAWGNTSGITPNLDAFAAESVVFREAYAQASTTSPSHASLFTSRYPTELAGPTRAPALEDKHTLAEVLGFYGYQTAARVAGGDLATSIGPTKGFDSYTPGTDFGSLYHTLPLGVRWLDERDTTRPFFLFLHSYDVHPAYFKPTPFGLLHARRGPLTDAEAAVLRTSERVIDGRLHPSHVLLEGMNRSFLRPRAEAARAWLETEVAKTDFPVVSSEQQQLIRDTYDGAASYADAWFGVMLARLEERGLLQNAWVIVVSDHGEALGDHQLFHRCCSLGDEISRVPLLIRPPGGVEGGRTVDALVELVDVMPTLLELADAAPPAGIRGRSVGAALRGEPFSGREYTLTEGGLNLRLTSVRLPDGRLTYTGLEGGAALRDEMIDTAQLPGPSFENFGLSAERASVARGVMSEWERSLVRPSQTSGVETPDELKDALVRHGYWDAR